MRRSPLAALFVALTLSGPAAILGGCNALTGVGDFTTGSGEGGRPGSDEDGPNGEGGGPPSDGSAVVDKDGGTVDPNIPVIAPSLTTCGTDSVCMTNTSGWAPALYLVFSISRMCPSNWPAPVMAKVSGGGECDCNCTPTPATACTGTITGQTGTANMCPGTPVVVPIASDGTCSRVPDGGIPAPFALTVSGATPTSCASAVDPSFGTPDDLMTCSNPTVTTSSVCTATEECVPQAAKMFGIPEGVLCIAHDGQAGCPKNLPMRIVTGTDIKDGRSCGATCACAPSDCKGGTIDAFSTTDCMENLRSFTVDGKCDPNGATTALSYKYTRSTGCKVTQQPQEMGSETFESPRTYCCQEPF